MRIMEWTRDWLSREDDAGLPPFSSRLLTAKFLAGHSAILLILLLLLPVSQIQLKGVGTEILAQSIIALGLLGNQERYLRHIFGGVFFLWVGLLAYLGDETSLSYQFVRFGYLILFLISLVTMGHQKLHKVWLGILALVSLAMIPIVFFPQIG